MLGYCQLDPETNFSEILIKIQNFSFMKMHMNILSEKCQPFYSGGDEFLTCIILLNSLTLFTGATTTCFHIIIFLPVMQIIGSWIDLLVPGEWKNENFINTKYMNVEMLVI